jgi:hypothetical protein
MSTKNVAMIDALGGVVPQNLPYGFISLKESDCYAIVDGSDNHEIYAHEPTSVVSGSIMWGSRVLKMHPLYWVDKRKLLTRILRSANTALFQQCKVHTEPIAVHAAVGFRGNTHVWLGVSGRICVWAHTGTRLDWIYPSDPSTYANPLGLHRYGFAPHIVPVPFKKQGFTIVTTGSISDLFIRSEPIEDSSIDKIRTMISSCDGNGSWLIIPHDECEFDLL